MKKFRIEKRIPYVPANKLKPIDIKILKIISDGEANSSLPNQACISMAVGRSKSTISARLKKLHLSGYITQDNDGLNNFYRIEESGMLVLRQVARFCEL